MTEGQPRARWGARYNAKQPTATGYGTTVWRGRQRHSGCQLRGSELRAWRRGECEKLKHQHFTPKTNWNLSFFFKKKSTKTVMSDTRRRITSWNDQNTSATWLQRRVSKTVVVTLSLFTKMPLTYILHRFLETA